ncbi:Aste57867_4181 [Aphanomyces stellatus]|uniref:Aste57867_4181 protein n=1 Tax=Aphanomyces stellatus TaxID=120398 RepID=A0A485KBD3_9STRA|nr:hypothetical protein As57867_004170 [Aphanomyces stellatus]VFT81304.1 Aste57867_4181 [Aphanomyces stellatus]
MLYRNNRKAWMTISLFSEWIGNLNECMRDSNRSILLLLDNASSHKCVGVDLTNVRVLLLPPNTTAWLQPMDAGIIASFKSHYKRRQMDNVIEILDNRPADLALPDYPKNLYAVDVLTAMKWLTEAWADVTPSTIRNCWRHTGIVPDSSLVSLLGALRIRPVSCVRDLLC